MGFFFPTREFSIETSLEFEAALGCLKRSVEPRAPWWGAFRIAPPPFHGRVLDGGSFELFPNRALQSRTALVLRGKLEPTASASRAVGRVEVRKEAKFAVGIVMFPAPVLFLAVSARSMQAGAGWAGLAPVFFVTVVVALVPLAMRLETSLTLRRLARVLQSAALAR